MRALLLTAITLTCWTHASNVAAAEGGKVDVARAKERLEKALANLKTAIEKIEQKKASDQDLTAALAALEPLKAALDAGNDAEAQDLDYARLALTARKELRSQRERVEARRLELRLAVSREGIELALVDLDGATERTAGKDTPDDAFNKARAAANEVTKALERAQPLVGQNAEFDAYVAKVKARVESQRNTIDQRQTGLAVDRQRARVEPAHKELTASLAGLNGKDADADPLAKVEAAAASAAKLLAEGKSLESKHKEYGAYAAKVAKDVEGAKKQVDTRRTELASAKHKEEIEAVRAALTDSVRALSRRDPSDELFIEADKAADLLRRQLDVAAALPAKSPAFAQYVVDTKRALAATQVDLQKRRLAVQLPRQKRKVEAARTAMTKALDGLQGTALNEERFTAAEAAAKNVEKALEEGVALEKDREYSTYAREVRKRIDEARARIAARKLAGEVGVQRARVQEAVDEVKAALARLPLSSDVKEAETGATVLEKTIEAGASFEAKDRGYATYADAAGKTAVEARKRIEARKLEIEVTGRSGVLEKVLASARGGVDGARLATAGPAQVEQAAASVKAAQDELAKSAALEKRDRSFATFAAKARSELVELEKALELAGHVIAFRRGPIAAMAEGTAAAEAAGKAAKLEAQRDGYAKAVERFKACRNQAAELLAEHPRIASDDFDAKSTVSTCGEQAESAEAKLTWVSAILAVYEGPAKALVLAKALIERAPGIQDAETKKASLKEALAHLESCLEKGKILQYKHPKLAEMKFDVGGGKMTLATVVAECLQRAKALRGGK